MKQAGGDDYETWRRTSADPGGSSGDACLIEQVEVLLPAPRAGEAAHDSETSLFDEGSFERSADPSGSTDDDG